MGKAPLRIRMGLSPKVNGLMVSMFESMDNVFELIVYLNG